MNLIQKILVGWICFFSFSQISCNKSSTSNSANADVYAAGKLDSGNFLVLKSWKNTNSVNLYQTNINSANASVTGITVAGGDVYISGSIDSMGNAVATYWKNGVPNYLTDCSTSAFATGIAVQGSDVYVSGYKKIPTGYVTSVAGYWKNGTFEKMDSTVAPEQKATGLCFVGADLYLCGTVKTTDPFSWDTQAAYWKNGQLNVLSDSLRILGFDAVVNQPNAIAVNGQNVYLAGSSQYFNGAGNLRNVAVYWKNGIWTKSVGNTIGGKSGISFSGSDVYIPGTAYPPAYQTPQNPTPVYWKNDSLIYLDNAMSGGTATCIYANGNDIYIGGSQGKATYWLNGSPVIIGDGTIQAIFVAPK